MSTVDPINVKKMFAKVIEVCTMHKMKSLLYLIDDAQDKLFIFSTQQFEELSSLISTFETSNTIYTHELCTEDIKELWMSRANKKKIVAQEGIKPSKPDLYLAYASNKEMISEKSSINNVPLKHMQTIIYNDSTELSLGSDLIDKQNRNFNFNSNVGYDSSHDSSQGHYEREVSANVKNSLINRNLKIKISKTEDSKDRMPQMIQPIKLEVMNLGRKRKPDLDLLPTPPVPNQAKGESVDRAYSTRILNELTTLKGDKDKDKIKNAILEIYNGCNQISDDESSDDSFIRELKLRSEQTKKKTEKPNPKSDESPFRIGEDFNSKRYTEDISNQTLYPGLKQQTGGIFTQASNLNIMADMSSLGYK